MERNKLPLVNKKVVFEIRYKLSEVNGGSFVIGSIAGGVYQHLRSRYKIINPLLKINKELKEKLVNLQLEYKSLTGHEFTESYISGAISGAAGGYMGGLATQSYYAKKASEIQTENQYLQDQINKLETAIKKIKTKNLMKKESATKLPTNTKVKFDDIPSAFDKLVSNNPNRDVTKALYEDFRENRIQNPISIFSSWTTNPYMIYADDVITDHIPLIPNLSLQNDGSLYTIFFTRNIIPQKEIETIVIGLSEKDSSYYFACQYTFNEIYRKYAYLLDPIVADSKQTNNIYYKDYLLHQILNFQAYCKTNKLPGLGRIIIKGYTPFQRFELFDFRLRPKVTATYYG